MKERKSKENFNGAARGGGQRPAIRSRDEREDAKAGIGQCLARVAPVLFCYIRKSRVSKRR